MAFLAAAALVLAPALPSQKECRIRFARHRFSGGYDSIFARLARRVPAGQPSKYLVHIMTCCCVGHSLPLVLLGSRVAESVMMTVCQVARRRRASCEKSPGGCRCMPTAEHRRIAYPENDILRGRTITSRLAGCRSVTSTFLACRLPSFISALPDVGLAALFKQMLGNRYSRPVTPTPILLIARPRPEQPFAFEMTHS